MLFHLLSLSLKPFSGNKCTTAKLTHPTFSCLTPKICFKADTNSVPESFFPHLLILGALVFPNRFF